ncbi:efflux RND transporter periplasmic adaptor subunit [Chiayiivirga flava]|uniref:RND family efflux transporter MFP subunit n=1 Tax=Chiayiivirga flava TaxID=659595 RepID=A0A7W8D341_9GAMM|nr:efflux RND transporter periplasmic adaptor subunit [Chiayiivirga flava]MBB5207041.1 RND family efflux transporter MFP subunit [Chiayiivirga flava]
MPLSARSPNRLLLRACCIAMCCVALVACGDKPAEEAGAAAGAVSASAMAVSLVAVQREALARSITASGPVAAWEEVSLGVELSGLRVAEVLVDVGDEVKRGDLLLTLDARTTQSELRQAQAAAKEAEAGTVLAVTALERGRALVERKLLAAADFDQLVAQRVQADARAATARAQLDAARLRLEFTQLRAPHDGVIAKRSIRPGQVVASGAELLTLIRQNRLEWRAELSDTQIGAVAPGVAVALTAPDGADVAGIVRAVSPSLDPASRTATVYADLPQPGALRAGMYVEGRIDLGSSDTLVLPRAAVVRRDGYSYVFGVDAQGRATRKRIEVGRLVGERLEVLSGVDEGERVVERGAGFLSDGDRVRVVDGASPAPTSP